MAKLVIGSQYRENYGTPDHTAWKNKGGSVYVVENLTDKQVEHININGIPTLTNLITQNGVMTTETVSYWNIMPDDMVTCEVWERPWTLTYDKTTKQWYAGRYTPREDFWDEGVTGKIESFTMCEGGFTESENYKVKYFYEEDEVAA